MSFRLTIVCPLALFGFLVLVDAKPLILVGVLESQPEGARILSSSGRPNLDAVRLRGRLFLRKRVDENAHPDIS